MLNVSFGVPAGMRAGGGISEATGMKKSGEVNNQALIQKRLKK